MIKPGIYAKHYSTLNSFILADNRKKGWYFNIREDSKDDPPLRNGLWSVRHNKTDYDGSSMVMPYNLWVFK